VAQPSKKLILIYAPSAIGGMAEHIHYQTMALMRYDVSCRLLCSPSFLEGKAVPYEVKRILLDLPVFKRPILIRKLIFIFKLLYNQYALAWQIFRQRPTLVLLESYSEYFSPFWIWPHLLLSKLFRIKYAANLHDPVRNFRLGPVWWHQLSIKLAYWPLRYGLIHQMPPEPSPIPKQVKIAEVPVGIYEVEMTGDMSESLRKTWGVPSQSKLFLSFGFIRDSKNIDLFMRAMVNFPEVFLAVIGTPASSKNKPLSFYQSLAEELGITERTYLSGEFVPDQAVASHFLAADFILLSYASSFVSQSGVLNIAASVRKPVLAAAGNGPLQECVTKFNLGVFVKPDSIPALEEGIKYLLTKQFPSPKWTEYAAYASWDTNVRKLLDMTGILDTELS